MDLAQMREHYSEVGLSEADVANDPMLQFEAWFKAWVATEPYDANACIVATVDADGWPSARAVLLKGFDARGFVFYTNRRSAKGSDLELNSRAALCFLWHPLERQVRVVGSAEHLPNAESDAYFASRPRGSQIAACASPQSQSISDRSELDRLVSQTEASYEGVDVPRPQHWGGYLVRPQLVEFWQGRRNRLHDRLRFVLKDSANEANARWRLERLAP